MLQQQTLQLDVARPVEADVARPVEADVARPVEAAPEAPRSDPWPLSTDSDTEPVRRPSAIHHELLLLSDASSVVVASILVLAADAAASGAGVAIHELTIHLGGLTLMMVNVFSWLMLLYLLGTYDRLSPSTETLAAQRIVGAALLQSLALGGVVVWWHPLPGALLLASLHFATLVPLALGLRKGVGVVLRHVRSLEPRSVLIVGSGRIAEEVYRRLLAEGPPIRSIGFVDDEVQGSTACSREIARRVIGGLDQLEAALMWNPVDEVIIALPIKSGYAKIQRALALCERVGVNSRHYADLMFSYERARPCVEQTESGAAVTIWSAPHDGRLVIKRLLDIALATVGIVIAAPVVLGCAALVKLTSPGPAFFTQERYGYRKRRFVMYKLRTMVTEAAAEQDALEAFNETDGPTFKLEKDPRVTRLGRFLRATSIDELPQLLNVLKGDMSLVGPRPLPVRDVHRFEESWLMRRFSVPPGLTCLWQVNGRSTVTFRDWMNLDLEYVDRWSLLLDFKILLRTIPAVLKRQGAV